jgi:ADP-heptose:LPS heptosyltransferase
MTMRVGDQCPELLNKVRFDLVRWTRGKGLDIGRGEYKAFPHFIGVREKIDTDFHAPASADFAVDSFDDMAQFIDGELDFIFVWCEADMRPQAWRMLKKGAHLITVLNGEIVVQRKMSDDAWLNEWETVDTSRREGKTALVIRYGAIGDSLQTASVLPELKRLGYHVTLNSHPDGEVVLRHDPNIDDFFVQDPNQVPNGELVNYWNHLATKYDRIVNLCECVEGTLLLFPGRANHRWPHEVRKKYCNKNYLEFMAEIAELTFQPEHHFYETFAETMKASVFMDRIAKQCNPDFVVGQATWNTPFVIMWALAGSSVHKCYPHQDAVIARILTEIPNAHVIMVGNAVCKILEQGWEKEPRVHLTCGEMELRDVLALANVCQLVIGPETGVLNSVAFEDVAKVVLLSHSTEENLTRDWVNTESLHSEITPCWPCHRLHYTNEFCPQDETTKAAMCQQDLAPSTVWEAVQRAYVGWGTVRQLLKP